MIIHVTDSKGDVCVDPGENGAILEAGGSGPPGGGKAGSWLLRLRKSIIFWYLGICVSVEMVRIAVKDNVTHPETTAIANTGSMFPGSKYRVVSRPCYYVPFDM